MSEVRDTIREISRRNECSRWLRVDSPLPRYADIEKKPIMMPLRKYARPISRGNKCAVWLGWFEATWPAPWPSLREEDDAPAVGELPQEDDVLAVGELPQVDGEPAAGELPQEDDPPAVGEPLQENDAPAVGIDAPVHPLPPSLSSNAGSGAGAAVSISVDLLQENLSSGFPESKSEAVPSFSQPKEEIDVVSKKDDVLAVGELLQVDGEPAVRELPQEDDPLAVREPLQENDAPAVGIEAPVHPLPPLLSPNAGGGASVSISMDLLQENLSSGFPESKSEAVPSFSQPKEEIDGVSKKKKKKKKKGKGQPPQSTAQTQSLPHPFPDKNDAPAESDRKLKSKAVSPQPALPPLSSATTLRASTEEEKNLKMASTTVTSSSSYVASPPLAEKVNVQEKAPVHDSDPLIEMPSIDQSPEKGDEKEKLVPEKPDFSHKVFFIKAISYLGRRFRIVLQDDNGPCAFIAISNYLILVNKVTLPYSTTVSAAKLLELIYPHVFRRMKNEEYDAAFAAVQQSVTGLDIDIRCSSIDGFVETAQYKIFKIIGLSLYHCWVLNLNLQEGAEIQAAVEDRSYDKLQLDRAAYRSEADGSSSSESSAREDMKRKYDLIDKFFSISVGQETDYGLSCLKEHVKDKELFAFFQNNHFSIMYKHNGTFFRLISDAGYRTNKGTWQMIDDNFRDCGLPLEDILTPMDQMLNASVADYGSKTAKHSHMKHPQYDRQSQHHRLSVPFESNSSKGHSKKALQHDSSSNNASSSSSSGSQARRLSPDFFKAQFASFFTEGDDKKLEEKFLNFLNGYKENDILYYGVTVKAMKALGTPEMQVFYEHIRSFDPIFAQSVCLCYERIRNNLNNAARTFIRELKIQDFHCETPVVRIREMPPPERWIPVKTFFTLDGNKPAEAHTIQCGKSSMTVTETTQVGRIILTNALIKLSRNHREGRSFNGQYTLDEVLVNDKLDVDIAAQFCDNSSRTSEQRDFVRLANDLLPEYIVDGKMPGYFRSLDQSLRSYIDHLTYGSDMLRKFHKFIEAHPSLKRSLTRLAVIDDIYSAHQSLTKYVKKLLQRILNSVPLVNDWKQVFHEQSDEKESEPRTAPIHRIVYNYHKKKQSNARKGPGEGKGDGSVEITEGGVSTSSNIQPFAGTTEGGMIFLRHVRHHGAEGSMDEMGTQHLKELSELDLLNAEVFEIVLPAVLESLTYNMGNFRSEYGEAAYDELLGWLEEILEQYRRPEVLSSS